MTLNVLYANTITYQASSLPSTTHTLYKNISTTTLVAIKTDEDTPANSVHTLQAAEVKIIPKEDKEEVLTTAPETFAIVDTQSVFTVPFYSQFTDITAAEWKKVGCGIASLAMLIDYYIPNPPSVDTLLQEGIDTHAYLSDAGWTYAGLIGVSKKYGFTGEAHDLSSATMDSAFDSLEEALVDGPVMVSVHYKFEPENPIPHLVVANTVSNGMLYYNDPAAKSGNLSIPINTFKDAWKKRYIEIRLAS